MKTVPIKDLGVPVPSPPSDPNVPVPLSVVCYFGTKGFAPSYSQSARTVAAISGLKTTQQAGVNYYDFPIASSLPAGATGAYDFYFTFCDTADGTGSESDFSPVVTETLDNAVPPTPGQPVVLA